MLRRRLGPRERTPRRHRRLTSRALAAVALTVATSSAPAQAALSSAATPAFATDGEVTAIARHGDDIYIGGAFSRVAPTTGGGVAISPTTAQPDLDLPKVSGGAGEIYAVEPDGSGGWYIGGWFLYVGGVPVNNLAHIRADGTVDPDFARGLTLPIDEIWTFARGSDHTLYIGGFIGGTASDGTPRRNLAAVDTRTGQVTDWNPSPDRGVGALAVASDGTVYVSGGFHAIGASQVTRVRLAALDPQTGNATAWRADLGPDGARTRIEDLAIGRDGTVYAGGEFTTIGGVSRHHIAALDPHTGAVTPWDPDAQDSNTDFSPEGVYALAIGDDGTVYAGGEFTNIGGANRNNLAALDPETGMATAWDPNVHSPPPPATNPFVLALRIGPDGTIYVGGHFERIGSNGAPRHNLAALDPAGNATGWDPHPFSADFAGMVYAVSATTNSIYAGGTFGAIGGAPRENLAELRASDGTPTAWDPGPDCQSDTYCRVLALDVGSDGTVYVGGYFSTIGANDAPRSSIAALDPDSGNATTWDPNARYDNSRGSVRAIAIAQNGTVYAGGIFKTIGSNAIPRSRLAALDPETAIATEWNPNVSNGLVSPPGQGLSVEELALGPTGTVYVAGLFTTIGANSAARHDLAAIDPVSGNATAFNPNPSGQAEDGDDGIKDLDVAPNGTVYVAGAFTSIGGASRPYLAALDPANGNATAWNPHVTSGSGYAVAVGADGNIYAAGNWGRLSPVPNNAAFTPVTGAWTGWSPWPNWFIHTLTAYPDGSLYAGGDFSNMLAPAAGFAMFRSPRDAPSNSEIPHIEGTPVIGQTLDCALGGTWLGEVEYLTYMWLRDGAPITGAAGETYAVAAADAGHDLACRITAHNWDSSASAASQPVHVHTASDGSGSGSDSGSGSGSGDGGSGGGWTPSGSSEFGPTGSSEAPDVGEGTSGASTSRPGNPLADPRTSSTVPIVSRLRVIATHLRAALSKGIPIRINVRRPGQITISVESRTRTARLSTVRYVTLGRVIVQVTKRGSATVHVRLNARARKALAGHQRVRLRIRAIATAPGRVQRLSRIYVLSSAGLASLRP